MDLKCPKCGEPWDNDGLHEVVSEGEYANYQEAYRAFIKDGCGVVFAGRPCLPDAKANMRSELADLMGDDSDGYMAMMEDMEMME